MAKSNGMAKSNQQSELKRKIRRRRRRAVLVTLLQVICVIAASAVTAFLIFSSVMIQENSMSPTLMAGDRVYVNRAAYAIGGVGRGDLIAYRGNGGANSSIHVKRVIGLPGETLQIRDGLILIDGKTYIENREFPNITKPGIAEEGIHLGSNEYFVLGDNRNNSEDSRFPDVGNISKNQIYGKVWFIGQPFSRTGFVG